MTAGGNTVVETFPVNTPQEMVTVYHLDKDAVVLTHYCSGGTQPRMRSKGLAGLRVDHFARLNDLINFSETKRRKLAVDVKAWLLVSNSRRTRLTRGLQ